MLVIPLAAVATAGGAEVDLIGVLETSDPSAAVYGEHVYPIAFDHAAHTELAACDTCHAGVAESDHAAQSFWPMMAVCASCHSEAADTSNDAACLLCHGDEYEPVWPDGPGWLTVRDPRFPLVAPEPAVRPVRNLIFSHVAHSELECARCHAERDGGPGSVGADLPGEHACLDCHEASGAASACETCHPAGPEGRLITVVPGNAVAPERVLRPSDHDGDWAVSHGLEVGVDALACQSCHDEADCQQCHDAVIGVDSPHPPGFTLHHGYEARRDATACASCHNPTGFCLDCHVDADVTTGETSRPPLGAEYHPADWVAPGGGGHVAESRRSLLDCASCHTEGDCASCHVFVNPHGPDFFGRCERLIDANPRVCAPCHEDLTDLRLRCR